MDHPVQENRQRWTKLHQDWRIAFLEARLARFELREREEGARAGENPWPTLEDTFRVEALEEIAERKREEADEFVHRLLS